MGNVYDGREGDSEFENALKEYLLTDDSDETEEALEAGAEWAAAGGVVDEVVDPQKEQEALEKLKKAASKGKGLGLAGKMSYLIAVAVSGSIGWYVLTSDSSGEEQTMIHPSYAMDVKEGDDGFYLRSDESPGQEESYVAQAITKEEEPQYSQITTTRSLPEETSTEENQITEEDIQMIKEAAEESADIPSNNLKWESNSDPDNMQVSGTKVVHNPGAYYDPDDVERVPDQPFESEEKNISPNIRRITVDGDWSSIEGNYYSSEHNLTYKLRERQGVVQGKGRGLEDFVVVTIDRDGTTHIVDRQYAEPLRLYFVRNEKGEVIGFKYTDVYITTMFKKR